MEPASTDQARDGNQVERWRDEALGAEVLVAEGNAPPLPSHHHPTWQVGRVTVGALRFDMGSTTAVARPGELIVIPPRVPHAIQPMSARVAYAQIEFMEDFLPDQGSGPYRSEGATALSSFQQVLDRSRRGDPIPSRHLAMQDLMVALETHGEGEASREADRDIDRVILFLRSVTDRVITVEELVQFSSLSRATLLRRFKAQTHTSPSSYHLSVRVHAACGLMDRGIAVGAAAIRTGFSDQSHFTRRARDVLAMGPARWKKRRRV